MLPKCEQKTNCFFRFLYIDHNANKNNNEFSIEQINKQSSLNWSMIWDRKQMFFGFCCCGCFFVDKMRIKWSDFYFWIWLKFCSPLAGRMEFFALYVKHKHSFSRVSGKTKRKCENFLLFFWKVPLSKRMEPNLIHVLRKWIAC